MQRCWRADVSRVTALLVAMAASGCDKSPAPASPPAATDPNPSRSGGRSGSTGGSPGSGGASGGSGGSASAPSDAPTTPGTGGSGVAPDSGSDTTAGAPEAAPADAGGTAPPAPPALGAFPLEAVKAAKAELYAAANAHVEGPTWRNGDVFFAADGAGWGLMRIDPARKLYRYHPTLLPVGTYLLADGSMLIGEHNLSLVQMFPDGKIAALAVDLGGQQIPFANDITLDASGNIYASDRRGGSIYRITPGGEVTKVAGGLDVPNGVEVDPASKYLYFATGNAIHRMTLPTTPGGTDYGKPEMLSSSGQPDGMAFDAWGNLWVAPWRTGHLQVHAPDGKVIANVDSGGGPINLCFGGKDNDTVFVATDFKGIYKIGPIPGLRGFLHPGAAKYTVKRMLDVLPANTPK